MGKMFIVKKIRFLFLNLALSPFFSFVAIMVTEQLWSRKYLPTKSFIISPNVVFIMLTNIVAASKDNGCVHEIRNRLGNITTPRNPNSTYLQCEWLFTFPQKTVLLDFLIFDLPRTEYDLCELAYMKYGTYDYKGRKVIQDKVCGGTPPKPYTSTNGKAWLTYTFTGGKDVRNKHFKGFVVQYTIYLSEHQENQIYVAITCGLVVPLSCCVPFFLRKLRNRQQKELDEEDTVRRLQKKEQLRRMLVPIKRNNWRQMSFRRKLLTQAIDGKPSEQPCKRRKLMLQSQTDNGLVSPIYAEIPVFDDPSYINPEDIHSTSRPSAVDSSNNIDSNHVQSNQLTIPGLKRGRNGTSVNCYTTLNEGSASKNTGHPLSNTYMSLCGITTTTIDEGRGSTSDQNYKKSADPRQSACSTGGLLPHEISSSTPVHQPGAAGFSKGDGMWNQRGRGEQKGKLESISELLDEVSDSKTSNQSMKAMQGSKDTLEPSSEEETKKIETLGRKSSQEESSVKRGHVIPTVIVHSDSLTDLSSSTCMKKATADHSTLDSSTISDPCPRYDGGLTLDENENILKKSVTTRKPPSLKKKPRTQSFEGESADSYISTGPSNGTLSESHTEENVDWSFEDDRHLSLIQECLEETDRTASIETMLKSREGSWNEKGNFSVHSIHKTNDSSNMTSSINDSVFKTFNKSSFEGTFTKDSALNVGTTFTISSSADATYTIDSPVKRNHVLLSETYDKFKTEEDDITIRSSPGRSSSWELTPGFAKPTSTKSPNKITNNAPKQCQVFSMVNDVASSDSSFLNTPSIRYLDKPPTETQFYDITDSDVSPPLPRKHLHSNTSPRDPSRLLSRDYLSTPNESMAEMICHGSILETMYYDLSDTDMIPPTKLQKNSINSVTYSPLEALPMLNEIELSNSLLRQRLSLSNTTLTTPLNSAGYFNRFQNVTVTRPKYNLNDDSSLVNWTPLERSVHRTGTWLDEHVFVTSPDDGMVKDLYTCTPKKAMFDSPSSLSIQNKSQLYVPSYIPGLDGSLTKHRAKIPLDCAGGILCRVASFSSLDVSLNGSHISLKMPDGLNQSVRNTHTSELNLDKDPIKNINDKINQDNKEPGTLKRMGSLADINLSKNRKETTEMMNNSSQRANIDFLEEEGINKLDKAGQNDIHKPNSAEKNDQEQYLSHIQINPCDKVEISTVESTTGSSENMSLEISKYLLSADKLDRMLVNESRIPFIDESSSPIKRQHKTKTPNKRNRESPSKSSSISELSQPPLIIIPREGPSVLRKGASINSNFPYSSPRFPRSLSAQELLPQQFEIPVSSSSKNGHGNVDGITPKNRVYRKYKSTGNVHTPHSCTFTPTLQSLNRPETPNPYNIRSPRLNQTPFKTLNTTGSVLTETAL